MYRACKKYTEEKSGARNETSFIRVRASHVIRAYYVIKEWHEGAKCTFERERAVYVEKILRNEKFLLTLHFEIIHKPFLYLKNYFS